MIIALWIVEQWCGQNNHIAAWIFTLLHIYLKHSVPLFPERAATKTVRITFLPIKIYWFEFREIDKAIPPTQFYQTRVPVKNPVMPSSLPLRCIPISFELVEWSALCDEPANSVAVRRNDFQAQHMFAVPILFSNWRNSRAAHWSGIRFCASYQFEFLKVYTNSRMWVNFYAGISNVWFTIVALAQVERRRNLKRLLLEVCCEKLLHWIYRYILLMEIIHSRRRNSGSLILDMLHHWTIRVSMCPLDFRLHKKKRKQK